MKDTVFFILRLGPPTLNRVDAVAVEEITEMEFDRAIGCQTPMGLLTLILSDKNVGEINDIYQSAAERCSDLAPVMIFKSTSPDVYIDMKSPAVNEMVSIFEKRHDVKINKEQCNMSLDDLLDKTSRTGMKSLTSAELSRLKELSK